jgi:Trk K+ transport system NAD-binding subunit
MEAKLSKKSFLVIGAGRFGSSVARNLYATGHDVMVVDKESISRVKIYYAII